MLKSSYTAPKLLASYTAADLCKAAEGFASSGCPW
jgi:hypothetical protein